WLDADLKAQGNISLHLAPSVYSALSSQTTAKGIWDYLETTYGKSGVPAIYQDFRAALALTVLADSNPVPNLDKFEAYFHRLETNKFIVADHVKGMMLIAKLSSNMGLMIQLYITGLKPATSKTAIKAITLARIHQQVVLHWEQHQGHQGQLCTSANKLSAVKRKGRARPFLPPAAAAAAAAAAAIAVPSRAAATRSPLWATWWTWSSTAARCAPICTLCIYC
ncbi:hypothetical protein DICSQDRAFT_73410, partial [Dichomitus squalens LYAD-421 SS1]